MEVGQHPLLVEGKTNKGGALGLTQSRTKGRSQSLVRMREWKSGRSPRWHSLCSVYHILLFSLELRAPSTVPWSPLEGRAHAQPHPGTVSLGVRSRTSWEAIPGKASWVGVHLAGTAGACLQLPAGKDMDRRAWNTGTHFWQLLF